MTFVITYKYYIKEDKKNLMNKNDTFEIEIIDIGHGGEGIGKVDGFPIFIKDAIIGDLVLVKLTKIKKSYGYGRIIELIRESEHRVPARCSIARTCGGCQVQEMSYAYQLQYKSKQVEENLIRIGGFEPQYVKRHMEEIIGMEDPFHYRNKAQFPFGTDAEGNPITGFYARRSHNIIPNTDCPLGVSVNHEILDLILAHMKENGIRSYNEEIGKGLLRHVLIRYGFSSKEIMVCFVINASSMKGFVNLDVLVEKLTKIPGMTSISYSVNRKKTNVIMGENYEVIWGQSYITDSIGEIHYQISPLSFFQVNPIQTERLYQLVLDYADLKGHEVVWDLYCGIGTISLYLAKHAKQVYGVEVIPQAIANAQVNAILNQMENTEFFVGKAEEVLPRYYQDNKAAGHNEYADVIVVDPPRKGCEASLLQTILEMKPEKIVYVSCDSATMARDLKILCESEYELTKVRPVDQFPMTIHVETVAILTRE